MFGDRETRGSYAPVAVTGSGEKLGVPESLQVQAKCLVQRETRLDSPPLPGKPRPQHSQIRLDVAPQRQLGTAATSPLGAQTSREEVRSRSPQLPPDGLCCALVCLPESSVLGFRRANPNPLRPAARMAEHQATTRLTSPRVVWPRPLISTGPGSPRSKTRAIRLSHRRGSNGVAQTGANEGKPMDISARRSLRGRHVSI